MLLTHVFNELNLMLMFFEHLDKFCDVILSPCIQQLHRRDRYTRYSKVSSVASSADTELISRNHCAEKQLDVFITTVEVYRLLVRFFDVMSNTPLSEALDARETGLPDSVTNWNIIIAAVLSHSLFGYQNKSCTMSFLVQVPRMTNDSKGICEHTSRLLQYSVHILRYCRFLHT